MVDGDDGGRSGSKRRIPVRKLLHLPRRKEKPPSAPAMLKPEVALKTCPVGAADAAPAAGLIVTVSGTFETEGGPEPGTE